MFVCLGLSFPAHPRSRGENPDPAVAAAIAEWLIPAHAGKTTRDRRRRGRRRAHPRSRGENLPSMVCTHDP